MRVAHIAGLLSRRASGVRQMVEGLSRAVAARGVDTRVFGIRDAAWDAGDRDAWRGAEARVLRCVGPVNPGIRPGLGRSLAAYDPDVVHLHGLWMHSAHVAAAWAARPGRVLVTSPHGMLAPAALTYSRGRKRVMRALWQDRCFARTAGYHATAAPEAANICAYLGEVPVAVVPNGIEDTHVLRPVWDARARRVLAIGRLHPVKGYDRLLRAWAQVEPQAPGWCLEIAGPDPDGHGDTLRALIAELGLSRATVGQPRFGAERDALIAGSRLFALPSLTENFALTVPEALVCGTPVLASTGAPWEALPRQGCGWWVDPEPAALADALRDAIGMDEARLAQMGQAGRDWALAEFGWDDIAARMTAFYADLLRESRAA